MGGCGNCCVMDNPVGDLARAIRDALCSDCCVGYTPSRPDSEIHAEKVANELADMIKRVDESTDKFVEKLLPYLGKDVDALLEEIEILNKNSYGGKKLNINLKAIKENNKEMEKQAKTFVGDIMRERLVLTDPELAVILDEKDDKKRSENFEAFVTKLRKSAVDELTVELENIVNKQQKIIYGEVEKRLEEIKSANQRSEEAFKTIAHLKENDEPALEREKIKYVYQRGVCDLLLNEIDH